MNNRLLVLLCVFVAGHLGISGLRWLALSDAGPDVSSNTVTYLYVGWTLLFAYLVTRKNVGFRQFGIARRFQPLLHIALAGAGVAFLQGVHGFLEPVMEGLFGAGRDLSRFEENIATPTDLAVLLIFSWAFAAFGEEFAFRGLLMRGLHVGLGGGRGAAVFALFVQAVVFGLIHLYQGPVGVIGAGISGLTFGALVLFARGALWPAVIAHGVNNTIGIVEIYLG